MCRPSGIAESHFGLLQRSPYGSRVSPQRPARTPGQRAERSPIFRGSFWGSVQGDPRSLEPSPGAGASQRAKAPRWSQSRPRASLWPLVAAHVLSRLGSCLPARPNSLADRAGFAATQCASRCGSTCLPEADIKPSGSPVRPRQVTRDLLIKRQWPFVDFVGFFCLSVVRGKPGASGGKAQQGRGQQNPGLLRFTLQRLCRKVFVAIVGCPKSAVSENRFGPAFVGAC
jgi:hypothetical protein